MDEFKTLIGFWNGSYEKIPAYSTDEATGCEMLDEKFKALAKSGCVLDFGCGSGWASLYLSRFGCKSVTGIDASENAIKLSKESAKLSGLEEKTCFICGKEKVLKDMEEASFDGAFSSNTLDVVPDEVTYSIIAEIKRVLKKHAVFILMLNAYADEERFKAIGMVKLREHHYAKDGVLRCVNRSTDEWKELLKDGFECLETCTFHFEGEPEWYQRRLLVLERK